MNNQSFRQKFAWGKAALIAFFLLVLANILILDYKIFIQKEPVEITSPSIIPAPQTETVTPTAPVVETNICPPACLEIISEATASGLAQPTSTPAPTTPGPMVKEFYIPLGTGSTTSQSWTEISGVEAVVDMANYPNVKSIIFEASMRIPTANGFVHAKLYNVTDQHDVWYSEVLSEGPISSRVESKNITLASGRKLYRVKMKSTMGYEAVLDSARIKILLE